MLLGVAAINWQSFWIDEGITAMLACQRTIGGWWQALLNDRGSSTQMPLYMFYMWLWEKLCGHSEWAFRAANLPWLALALLALWRRRAFFVVAIVFSPFVWFYLNEARPYLMQVALALILIAALWRLSEIQPTRVSNRPRPPSRPRPRSSADRIEDEKENEEEDERSPLVTPLVTSAERLWVACFALGLVLLAGSSLLGLLWDAAALACALAILGRNGLVRLARCCWRTVAVSALSLFALALFYLWSLRHGARATEGATGFANVLFAGYELLGLAGLGPGRLEIREHGVKAFLPFALRLAVHAAVAGFVLWSGVISIIRNSPRRLWFGVAAAASGATVLLFSLAHVTHFRALGRHFAPMAALLLLLYATGLVSLWPRGGWRRGCVLLFLLLSLASGFSLRAVQRHAKDDYRGAVALARSASASRQRVWWCAGAEAARLYGLDVSTNIPAAPNDQVWSAVNCSKELLANQPAPQLIVLSKPDVYDNAGAMVDYLGSHHYQLWRTLPAFSFWRPAEERVPASR
jgi:hypothetical protein